MRTWLLLALPSPLLVFALEKLHGVSPQLASQYVETAGQWTCLDGSKKISWKDVNDDYCDCPDGSDEPGCHVPTLFDFESSLTRKQGLAHVRTPPSTARMQDT